MFYVIFQMKNENLLYFSNCMKNNNKFCILSPYCIFIITFFKFTHDNFLNNRNAFKDRGIKYVQKGILTNLSIK